MPRGNVNTLIKNSARTPQELKEMSTKGGIKSGQVRRLKKLLKDEYNQGIILQRFEIIFFDGLDKLISAFDQNIKTIRQFGILGYSVDGYIPKYNIFIEYDEKFHKYKKNHDIERQNKIIEYYGNNIIFIRVNKGQEFEGYKNIIKEMIKYEQSTSNA